MLYNEEWSNGSISSQEYNSLKLILSPSRYLWVNISIWSTVRHLGKTSPVTCLCAIFDGLRFYALLHTLIAWMAVQLRFSKLKYCQAMSITISILKKHCSRHNTKRDKSKVKYRPCIKIKTFWEGGCGVTTIYSLPSVLYNNKLDNMLKVWSIHARHVRLSNSLSNMAQ